MAGGVAGEIAAQLTRDGWPADTPMAAVVAAGSDDEMIIEATLATLPARLATRGAATAAAPVLLLCGAAAASRFRADLGALAGRRVLLTMSDALLPAAIRRVRDFGGRPVARPMIRLTLCRDDLGWTHRLDAFDWLVLTSPSAADALVTALREAHTDLRRLPRLFVTGAGTAARLARHGLVADAMPAAGVDVREGALQVLPAGTRVLRLRADRAGGELSSLLTAHGMHVEDIVLYRNEPITYAAPPAFDCALFASGSAVDAFVAQWGAAALAGRTVAAFRGSACAALTRAGVTVDVTAAEMSAERCVEDLARHLMRRELGSR
jgi:uroporphyrinogen-III synthase